MWSKTYAILWAPLHFHDTFPIGMDEVKECCDVYTEISPNKASNFSNKSKDIMKDMRESKEEAIRNEHVRVKLQQVNELFVRTMIT